MNFLSLCQRAVTECGASGTLATTAGQIGSLGRIVNWVGDAWNELQTEREDWDWMRSSSMLGQGVSFVPAFGQFNTPLGTGAGQLGIDPDTFGKWDEETFRCYTTPTGVSSGAIGLGAAGEMPIGVTGLITGGTSDETFLDCIEYDNWRNGYMFGAMREVHTRPYVVAIGPDQSLCLGPPPNGLYTITGDYWVAPSLMALDTDTPLGLPTRFHMLVVYAAMLKYGYYEAASDVIQRAQAEYGRMYRELEARRLPRMGFSGALA